MQYPDVFLKMYVAQGITGKIKHSHEIIPREGLNSINPIIISIINILALEINESVMMISKSQISV